jgi:hypothetical protein
VLASRSPPGAALRKAGLVLYPTKVQPLAYLWPAWPRSGPRKSVSRYLSLLRQSPTLSGRMDSIESDAVDGAGIEVP